MKNGQIPGKIENQVRAKIEPSFSEITTPNVDRYERKNKPSTQCNNNNILSESF